MLVPFSGLQTEDYLVSGELKPILNSVLKIKNKKNHETHNYEVSFGKKKRTWELPFKNYNLKCMLVSDICNQ